MTGSWLDWCHSRKHHHPVDAPAVDRLDALRRLAERIFPSAVDTDLLEVCVNLVVDHPTGGRAVPVFAFVARQRNIRDFFPELTSEDAIHEHLNHHAKRFEKTELQDVELRHIVKGRILRPLDPEKIAAEIEELVEAHRRFLPTLLQNADVAYLKDVYPFHPALIETLVDVSAAMQRERSALRLLYELLVIHHPDLPVGHFLPVGSAFDAIFPETGVEASENEARFKEIHRQYHHYLVPAMSKLRDEGELDDENHRMLDQLLKTVLLSEVSLRLKGNGLTIYRLVGLNVVDVSGATDRRRINKAADALVALSRRVPELQISGSLSAASKGQALVRYSLSTVSLRDVLERARAKVGQSKPAWMRLLLDVLLPMLGLEGKKGFEGYNPPLTADLKQDWRKTTRTGIVRFCNVREAAYGDFNAPVGAFRILIDYPWDDGHTVDEDRLRAANARKRNGSQFTVCWLPRHFESQERELMQELCAVRHLLSKMGKEDLLRDLGTQDRQTILNEAESRQASLRDELENILRRVYVDQGEVVPLTDDIDTSRPFKDVLGRNLEYFATTLLDRRYPTHPSFSVRPTKKDLERLLDWLVRASEAGQTPVEFDTETAKVLRNVGQALELVNLGQTRGQLRLDSRYFREIERKLHQANQPRLNWSELKDHLETEHGLQNQVIDVFLGLLCARGHRPLDARTEEVVTVGIGTTAKVPLILERAKLLEVAPWGRVREIGDVLFAVKTSMHRALSEQDRFSAQLRDAGRRRRTELSDLHQRLTTLDVPAGASRLEELKEARKRLAPLETERTDSYAALSDLLAAWDDDALARLRIVIFRTADMTAALTELDVQDRTSLEAGRAHAEIGPEVAAHLDKLAKLLAASEHSDSLTLKKIEEWNDQAHLLVRKLITTPPIPPPKPKSKVDQHLFEAEPLDLASEDEVQEFLGALRDKLEAQEKARVRLDVTLRREVDG